MLLAKQTVKVTMEQANRWAQLIQAKYGQCPYQAAKSKISSTWMETSKLEHLTKHMMQQEIGDGHDSWLRELPLCKYPLTINFQRLEMVKLSEYIGNDW